MRKLHALLAGLFLILASNKIPAQTITPDVANFTFAVTGNNVAFTNTSVLGNVPGERRAWWIFGDGTSQHSPALGNMQHTYSVAGTYTVCLKIYKYVLNDSFLTAQVCKTVALQNSTILCGANFEFRDSITTTSPPTHLVKFTAIPSHSQNRPVTEVCWNFGDGSPVVCIQATATTTPAQLLTILHTYTGSGPYNACVKIKYQEGCVAEKCRTIQLQNLPPPDSCRANFERINSTIGTNLNPLRATFKALPWHNNNKKPVRICWTFGDGTDTCIQYSNSYTGPYIVSHTYANAGFYQVCVKIRYEGGCEAQKCEQVRIEIPATCHADFERIPSVNNHPRSASFRALPLHSNNRKPQKICWTFGDGRDTCINYPETYTGQYTVNHLYNLPGQYEVCVKIFYYGGCEARKCRLIQIAAPDECRADFETLTTVSNSPLTKRFKALPWHNNNRKPSRVCWTFGDGRDTCINYPETYTGSYLVEHRYEHPGQYEVCVKINYYGGCEARKCRNVVIQTAPSICGGYMIDSLVGPRTYKFKGFSIHSPGDNVLSYRWTFGDGTTALGQEVTHTYAIGGQYQVCLTIKTQLGCETRICKNLHIAGSGQPNLVLTPNPVVNELHALFFSLHTQPVMIKITNQFGVVVRTYTRNAVTGSNNWGFDVSGLTPGIYTFTVQSATQLASAIFIKL